MPRGMPMSRARTMEITASSKVTGRDAAVRSSTLCCARDEKPRLPVNRLPSQEKNCTNRGCSKAATNCAFC